MTLKFDSRELSRNRVIRAFFINPKILLLNVASFLTIALFSGTFRTAGFLFLYASLNFAITVGLEKIQQVEMRKHLYWFSIAANVFTFLYLQHQGFIGILDSNNATTPSTLPFLMGYAFYTLQVLAIQGAIFRGIISGLDYQRYILAVSFCGAFLAGPIFNQDQLQAFEDLDISFPTPERIYQHLQFLVGAFMFKYVFANWLSQWVNTLETSNPLIIARSVFCFELQVYFDFAGYSLLSFFLCRIFCIPMYHNFQHPFAARNIPDFWRRWHVGLGTFFKENIFLPLKDIYPQRWATRVALPIIVFLLSALWHGPTRNFVLWGLAHGSAFVITVAILKRWQRWLPVRVGARISVFIVLFYGRLLFMESDFERLMQKFYQLGKFKQMGQDLVLLAASPSQLISSLFQHWDSTVVGLGIVLVLAYEIFGINPKDMRCYRYFKPGVWALVLLFLTLLFFQPAEHAGFVYGR